MMRPEVGRLPGWLPPFAFTAAFLGAFSAFGALLFTTFVPLVALVFGVGALEASFLGLVAGAILTIRLSTLFRPIKRIQSNSNSSSKEVN